MGDRRLHFTCQPVAAVGDGYRVEARAILWRARTILQVPASAVFRDGEGWAVFAVEQGKAVKRGVQVGHAHRPAGPDHVRPAGRDHVISHPDDRVHDGVHVTARVNLPLPGRSSFWETGLKPRRVVVVSY